MPALLDWPVAHLSLRSTLFLGTIISDIESAETVSMVFNGGILDCLHFTICDLAAHRGLSREPIDKNYVSTI